MEVTAVCCVLGLTTTFVYYIWRFFNWSWFQPKKKEKFLKDQGLDGTSYKFIFGDLKEMARMTAESQSKPMSLTNDIAPRVAPFFYRLFNTHGKGYFTWIGPKPLIHIYEPSMIREMLTNYRQFQKPSGENPLTMLLVKGLLNTQGDQWVKHKKIINPAFHVDKLKHMVPAFYVTSSEMIQKWGEMLMEKRMGEVDVWPHIQTFSSDVISRTSFGSSFEEGRKICKLQKEQEKLVMNAILSVYIPGSRFLPTKNNMRMKAIAQEVKASIRSIIDKRFTEMEASRNGHNDLLGILLDSNYNESRKHVDKSNGLSIEEIIEECKLFYAAGQETTANLLVWTMILLSQHKDWQTRAREEVFNVFGERKPDIGGLNQLKVINMILNEVLRLYPPITIITRQILEETKLGNITLPAHSFIQVNTLLIHHDQSLWGDDVNEFKPQRFSEGVSKVNKGQTSFLPFGRGPRICIGQSFAMMQAKVTLVMILQCFCFELSPLYLHAPQTVVTLEPEFGAHLILHKL